MLQTKKKLKIIIKHYEENKKNNKMCRNLKKITKYYEE